MWHGRFYSASRPFELEPHTFAVFLPSSQQKSAIWTIQKWGSDWLRGGALSNDVLSKASAAGFLPSMDAVNQDGVPTNKRERSSLTPAHKRHRGQVVRHNVALSNESLVSSDCATPSPAQAAARGDGLLKEEPPLKEEANRCLKEHNSYSSLENAVFI